VGALRPLAPLNICQGITIILRPRKKRGKKLAPFAALWLFEGSIGYVLSRQLFLSDGEEQASSRGSREKEKSEGCAAPAVGRLSDGHQKDCFSTTEM